MNRNKVQYAATETNSAFYFFTLQLPKYNRRCFIVIRQNDSYQQGVYDMKKSIYTLTIYNHSRL